MDFLLILFIPFAIIVIIKIINNVIKENLEKKRQKKILHKNIQFKQENVLKASQFTALTGKQAINNFKNLYTLNDEGLNYYRQGHNGLAIEKYTEALSCFNEMPPNNKANPADIYFNRGRAYQKKGEHLKAINDFNKAITYFPNDSSAYNAVGWSFFKIGDSIEAIKKITQAINLNPNFQTAYFNRGLIYTERKEIAKAIKDFRKAIELKLKTFLTILLNIIKLIMTILII